MLRGIELMFSSLKFDEDLFAYLALARTLEDMMELVEKADPDDRNAASGSGKLHE